MGLEPRIGRYFRRHLDRVLDVAEAPAGIKLPVPDSDAPCLLYLHVPFCFSLCPFCSFHRVEFEPSATESYFISLRREIELVTDAGFRFDELYIGGGTPTVLPDELVHTIEYVRKRHPLGDVSVETNPDHLRGDELSKLHDAGVTRLSVGVQSMDNALLREMHRFNEYGSAEDIRDRLREAEGVFETLNVDMIFNFPHQSEASLRRDLEILSDDLHVDQVSYYPLMTVDSTRNTMLETVGRVDYAREKDFYSLIANHFLAAGYSRSSAWCFSSKEGLSDEYITSRDDYLGLGSGSFSYLEGQLLLSTFSIEHYRRLVADGRSGIVRSRVMQERDQLRYYLLTKLFAGALDTAAAESKFGGQFMRAMRVDLAVLRALRAIEISGQTIYLTERGQYFWIVLMREFFAGVNGLRDQMRKKGGDSEMYLSSGTRFTTRITRTARSDRSTHPGVSELE